MTLLIKPDGHVTENLIDDLDVAMKELEGQIVARKKSIAYYEMQVLEMECRLYELDKVRRLIDNMTRNGF
jgi:hypothetical protein